MLIGGVSLTVYKKLQGTPFAGFYEWFYPEHITALGKEMIAGAMGLSFVVSILIVVSVLVLRQLSNWLLAFTAGGMLAFSPYFIAHTQDFHVDGMEASFMLVSALLILLYGQKRKTAYLLLSGLAAGAAVLSKTPSLFLLPFTGLTLLTYTAIRVREGWSETKENRRQWLWKEVWHGVVLPLILWGVMLSLLVALWPAIWVKPIRTLADLFLKTRDHVTNAHPLPRFLLGRRYLDARPPLTFYLWTFLFKSTFVTLSLAIVAVGHYSLWRKRVTAPVTVITFWLMVAFIIFFIAEMTIGAKQIPRYILPAMPMLSIIASIGAVGMVNLLQRGFSTDLWKRTALAVPIVAVGLEALIAFSYAPDFAIPNNHLLGGSQVAQHVIELMDNAESSNYVGQ